MKTSKWFLTSFFPVTLLLLMSTAFLLVIIFKIIFFLASYRTVITAANVTNVFYLSSELNMSHMPLRLGQSGLFGFCFVLFYAWNFSFSICHFSYLSDSVWSSYPTHTRSGRSWILTPAISQSRQSGCAHSSPLSSNHCWVYNIYPDFLLVCWTIYFICLFYILIQNTIQVSIAFSIMSLKLFFFFLYCEMEM